MIIEYTSSNTRHNFIPRGTRISQLSSKVKRERALKSNILTCIPPELLRMILILLNMHSLRSLIQAFPDELRGFFLVMTDADSVSSPLVFFKDLGLKKIMVQHLTPAKLAEIKPLIKIFEYVNWWPANLSHTLAYDKRVSYPLGLLNPLVDKYSFVYYSSKLNFQTAISRVEIMVNTGAHVELDEDAAEFTELTFGPQGRFGLNPKAPLFNKPSDWPRFKGQCASGLKSLRIQYVNMVEKLTFNALEKLTVFFGINGNEMSNSDYPTIRKLTAPKLRSFAVFYHDRVPILEDIRVGSKIQRQEYVDLGLNPTVFRFIQVDAMEKSVKAPLPRMQMPDQSILDFDFNFLQYYASAHIIGGPNEIISSLNLRKCIDLVWWQTHAQNMDSDGQPLHEITEIVAQNLMYFTFETRLPDTTVPLIITDSTEQMRYIGITTRALGLNLNGIIGKFSKGVISIIIQCLAFPETKEEIENYLPLYLNFKEAEIDFMFPFLHNFRVLGFIELDTDLTVTEMYDNLMTKMPESAHCDGVVPFCSLLAGNTFKEVTTVIPIAKGLPRPVPQRPTYLRSYHDQLADMARGYLFAKYGPVAGAKMLKSEHKNGFKDFTHDDLN